MCICTVSTGCISRPRLTRSSRRAAVVAILLAVLGAAALGAALGYFLAVRRVHAARWDASAAMDTPIAAGPRPRVVVPETEHDFGRMDASETGEYSFVVRNRGDAPLTLEGGDTTCRCTVSEIAHPRVPPGGETTVTLAWRFDDRLGPFEQRAYIDTNDSDQPRVALTVRGEITRALRADPDALALGSLLPDQPKTAEVHLLAYGDEPLEVVEAAPSDTAAARFFAVEVQPLPPQFLQEDGTATSGAMLALTVKPGLPPGGFRQTIRVRTNLPAAPELEIPVYGTVTSDLSVVGKGWNEGRGVLWLGHVSPGSSHSTWLLARGTHREAVQFRVVGVEPQWLKVELGESRAINRGAVIQTPLEIRIPADAPTGSHLGTDTGPFGEILLETGHPQTPQLKILVSFAVTG